MTDKPTPLTPSQRVQRANRALIERGGRRMPGGYLQPETAQQLEELLSAGYAASPVAVIATALRDAHKKILRNTKQTHVKRLTML